MSTDAQAVVNRYDLLLISCFLEFVYVIMWLIQKMLLWPCGSQFLTCIFVYSCSYIHVCVMRFDYNLNARFHHSNMFNRMTLSIDGICKYSECRKSNFLARGMRNGFEIQSVYIFSIIFVKIVKKIKCVVLVTLWWLVLWVHAVYFVYIMYIIFLPLALFMSIWSQWYTL